VQGRKDIPLSARGLRQTKLVGEYVNRNYAIDRVLSSDRSRCVETARTIDAPLSASPLLRELDFGDREGQKWSDIRAGSPELTGQLLAADPSFTAPGGESYSSYSTRIPQIIQEEDLRDLSGTIAVVTHDGVVRSLIARILNWPASTLSSTTVFVGSVSSIFVRDGIPRLDLLNHFEHLTPSYVNAATGSESQ
jgi:broad specificity phosphatase PhoE